MTRPLTAREVTTLLLEETGWRDSQRILTAMTAENSGPLQARMGAIASRGANAAVRAGRTGDLPRWEQDFIREGKRTR